MRIHSRNTETIPPIVISIGFETTEP